MERTDQQNKIQDELISLCENAKGYIEIVFLSASANRNIPDDFTHAKKIGDRCSLLLREPETPEDLNKWADAIIRAEEIMDEIEKERFWKYSNPNFFEAMRERVSDKMRQLKRY